MATVVKEMAVAVATYQDRNTGRDKNRYKNIGVLMESRNDDGSINQFLLMDRTFNPAGVPVKPGSDKILVSLFDPREGDSRGSGQQQGQSNNDGYDQSDPARQAPSRDLDDEIPF